MLKAVAQGKAHWLLDRAVERELGVKRRPQEDLVTSAVFGSIDLLEDGARREALRLLLGATIWDAFSPPPDSKIKIDHWPQGMRDGNKRVEPDLVIRAGNRTMIVEVKWYTTLSPDQLGKEVRAVERYDRREVCAILLLGEPNLPANFDPGKRCADARTWRDVARDVMRGPLDSITPLGRWKTMIAEFLRATEFGRVFQGFSDLSFAPVKPSSYRLAGPYSSPWLSQQINAVGNTYYEWRGK